MRVISIDLDLLHQGEGDAIVQPAELDDLFVGAGLLMAELVAGEAYDDEALVLVLLVEGLEAVVLGSEAALGRGVDDQEDFAFIVGEFHIRPVVGDGGEVIHLSGLVGLAGGEEERSAQGCDDEEKSGFHGSFIGCY